MAVRVAVVGATGNVGSSLVPLLQGDPRVDHVVGMARRPPADDLFGIEWRQADIVSDDLVSPLRDVDAVVHLAWAIQPSRSRLEQWRTNVHGTRRLLDAVAAADVKALVYASSVATYSPVEPNARTEPVDESWLTDGVPGAAYSEQKAYVERLLDGFQAAHPDIRVARMRPTFMLKPEAAEEIRRFFVGPLLPSPLVGSWLAPLMRRAPFLYQVMHTDDAAAAFREAVVEPVHGAFNLSVGPVLGTDGPAIRFESVATMAAKASWLLRIHPVDPALVPVLLRIPLLDAHRARTELHWQAQRSSVETLEEFIHALGRATGGPTPALAKQAGGEGRWRELATGVGGRGEAA